MSTGHTFFVSSFCIQKHTTVSASLLAAPTLTRHKVQTSTSGYHRVCMHSLLWMQPHVACDSIYSCSASGPSCIGMPGCVAHGTRIAYSICFLHDGTRTLGVQPLLPGLVHMHYAGVCIRLVPAKSIRLLRDLQAMATRAPTPAAGDANSNLDMNLP